MSYVFTLCKKTFQYLRNWQEQYVSTRTGLMLLFLLALTARITVVQLFGNTHFEGEPLTYEHGTIAKNLLSGDGFSITYLGVEGPTSQQAPFYPFVLAGLYSLFGIDSPFALWLMQIMQCLIGSSTVLCVTWMCWSFLPRHRTVGWIAGLGMALYPSHVYMVTHFQVVTWATFLLTLLVAVAASKKIQHTTSGAILLGVLGGCLLLVDPILGLALPVIAIMYWLGTSKQERWSLRHLAKTVSIAVVTLAVISPWMIRNYFVHQEVVLIKSSFGYAFWQGNNSISWGTDKIPKSTVPQMLANHGGTWVGLNQAMWEGRHETLYIDDVLLKPSGYQEFQGLTEPERSRLLGDRAFEFIANNPQRYAALCFQRLGYFLLFDETNPKTQNKVYRASTVIWFTLCVIGVFVIRHDWKRVWPTLAIFALVTIFHSVTIVSARFRIPVEPLTFLWASYIIVPFMQCATSQVRSSNQSNTNEEHVSIPLKGPHTRPAKAPHEVETARSRKSIDKAA